MGTLKERRKDVTEAGGNSAVYRAGVRRVVEDRPSKIFISEFRYSTKISVHINTIKKA